MHFIKEQVLSGRFVAAGSDGGLVMQGLQNNLAAIVGYQKCPRHCNERI